MTDPTPTPTPAPAPAPTPDPGKQDQAFTQADVDRIVSERVQRERAKFADYDDLKAKAGQSKTLEDRIAELETSTAKSAADATRARIAAEFGISMKAGEKGEPSDADLFLTGADEATLRAQAERLAATESERKKKNNVSPREGTSTRPDADPKRAWLRGLRDD